MVRLRAARSTDAGQIGEIMTRANAAPLWKPNLHSGAEDVAFCGRMIERGWVRVAEAQERRIAGFIARDGQAVNVLFVHPRHQGRGVGTALLDDAKASADRLELWTFQKNDGARRFYLRHGFKEAGRGDGSANEEGLPDIRFVWENE